MSALDPGVLGTLVAATPLLDRAGEQLPPLISVNIDERGVSLMPWLAGAPLTALLAWAEQLRDPVFTVTRPDRFDTTVVTARGSLDGLDVSVVACTHRNIEDVRVPGLTVSELSVRRAAAYETPLAALTPAVREGN